MLLALKKNFRLSLFLPFLLIFLSVLIIFWRGLFNFFLQDDFYNIYLGWTRNFLPSPLYAYRPIPFNLFGFVIFYIFRLNAFLSHSVLFLIHFVNIYLLYRFLEIIFREQKVRLFAVFLYAVSAINFGTLYWLTAGYISQGMTFLLLILLLIIKYQSKKLSMGRLAVFTALYILMLATSEALFVFPLFLLVLIKFKKIKADKRLITASFVISAISFWYRFIYANLKNIPDYKIGTVKDVLETLRWYLWRGLNIPEGIQNMEGGGRNLIFLLSAVLLFIVTVTILTKFRRKVKFNHNNFLLAAFWFVIFGFPFFLLPYHMSPYYLTYALVGIIIILAEVLSPSKTSILIFSIFYFAVSYLGVSYMDKTHWIVTRAKTAKFYLDKVRRQYPALTTNSTVIFADTDTPFSEIKVALSDDKAIQLFYGDKTIKVFYGRK